MYIPFLLIAALPGLSWGAHPGYIIYYNIIVIFTIVNILVIKCIAISLSHASCPGCPPGEGSDREDPSLSNRIVSITTINRIAIITTINIIGIITTANRNHSNVIISHA